MKLYHIRNWNSLYENSRSRTVGELSWVAVPNHHDGENYSALITHKKGAELFAAWVLIIQVASRCQPRGTLLRDNKTPHTPLSLSLKTRAPKEWFELALDYLESQTDWLETEDVASDCQASVRQVSPNCQSSAEEQKGTEQNRMEGNGRKGTLMSGKPDDREIGILTHARVAIHYLNEKSGRGFRETDANLTVISARLKEPDVTIEGVKLMIERQCAMWKNDRMQEFLRPETLFGKTKFDGYYAGRELPVPATNGTHQTHNPDHSKGF